MTVQFSDDITRMYTELHLKCLCSLVTILHACTRTAPVGCWSQNDITFPKTKGGSLWQAALDICEPCRTWDLPSSGPREEPSRCLRTGLVMLCRVQQAYCTSLSARCWFGLSWPQNRSACRIGCIWRPRVVGVATMARSRRSCRRERSWWQPWRASAHGCLQRRPCAPRRGVKRELRAGQRGG